MTVRKAGDKGECWTAMLEGGQQNQLHRYIVARADSPDAIGRHVDAPESEPGSLAVVVSGIHAPSSMNEVNGKLYRWHLATFRRCTV